MERSYGAFMTLCPAARPPCPPKLGAVRSDRRAVSCVPNLTQGHHASGLDHRVNFLFVFWIYDRVPALAEQGCRAFS